MVNTKVFSDYFSKLGKKGGNKTKLKGKKYYSAIGKLGAKKRWKK